MQENTIKTDVIRKKRNAKSLKKVNLDRLEARILNIIYRDINKILVKSYGEQLKESEAKTVTTYLKTIKEIKKIRQEDMDNISDQELEDITKQSTK